MVIATFRATGWAGRNITYDGLGFTLSGIGPLAATQILDYDDSGLLRWTTGEARRLTLAVASHIPAEPRTLTAPPHGNGEGQNLSRELLVMLILVTVLCLIFVFGVAAYDVYALSSSAFLAALGLK